MTERRCLEIGPGDTKLGPEWVTLDATRKPFHVDHIYQWGVGPLPFNANDFDLVYASHVLEHVPWFQTVDALKEVYRILRPGGAFEVWVPNFYYLVQCYLNQKCGDDWRKHNPTDDPMVWLNGRIFTYGGPGGLGDPNWHRAVFDCNYLCQCLKDAGFHNLLRIDFIEKPRGHDHGDINLGMRAYKP